MSEHKLGAIKPLFVTIGTTGTQRVITTFGIWPSSLITTYGRVYDVTKVVIIISTTEGF